MSTVVQPQTRVKAQGTAAKVRVGLWDLVRAELTRSRRTFTWGVIGATLIFTVHTIILANASISSGVVTELQWNGNALAWMHMYAGGFAVPLGLLTGAMAQWREQRSLVLRPVPGGGRRLFCNSSNPTPVGDRILERKSR